MRHAFTALHALLGNALLIAAAVHALAALAHHYVRHDGALRRMLPGPRHSGATGR